jgi:flavodoxin I
MKVLIVYDSMYGNTEKVAKSMGSTIATDVTVLRASEAHSFDVKSIDVLIVGSPTQAFKPTKPVQTFIKNIPGDAITGMDVAAFDTRMGASDIGRGIGFLVKLGGYAAPRIAKALKKKGGTLVAPPEGFFVTGKEGPLKEGELDRAANWAKKIVKK